MKNHKSLGFTIVELIIVVVIISILAAISITAFTGIQTRAENTKTVKGVSDYSRIIKAYAVNASDGLYPIATNYPCLGDASETCGVVPSGNCFYITSVTGTTSFVNAIKTITTSMPQVSRQTMACSSTDNGVTTTGTAKGAFYYSADGKTAVIGYLLRGNLQCDQPVGLTIFQRNQGADTTFCYGYLPILS